MKTIIPIGMAIIGLNLLPFKNTAKKTAEMEIFHDLLENFQTISLSLKFLIHTVVSNLSVYL